MGILNIHSCGARNLGYFFFSGDFQGMGVVNACPAVVGFNTTFPTPHSFVPNPCMPTPGPGGVLDMGDLTWSGAALP